MASAYFEGPTQEYEIHLQSSFLGPIEYFLPKLLGTAELTAAEIASVVNKFKSSSDVAISYYSRDAQLEVRGSLYLAYVSTDIGYAVKDTLGVKDWMTTEFEYGVVANVVNGSLVPSLIRLRIGLNSIILAESVAIREASFSISNLKAPIPTIKVGAIIHVQISENEKLVLEADVSHKQLDTVPPLKEIKFKGKLLNEWTPAAGQGYARVTDGELAITLEGKGSLSSSSYNYSVVEAELTGKGFVRYASAPLGPPAPTFTGPSLSGGPPSLSGPGIPPPPVSYSSSAVQQSELTIHFEPRIGWHRFFIIISGTVLLDPSNLFQANSSYLEYFMGKDIMLKGTSDLIIATYDANNKSAYVWNETTVSIGKASRLALRAINQTEDRVVTGLTVYVAAQASKDGSLFAPVSDAFTFPEKSPPLEIKGHFYRPSLKMKNHDFDFTGNFSVVEYKMAELLTAERIDVGVHVTGRTSEEENTETYTQSEVVVGAYDVQALANLDQAAVAAELVGVIREHDLLLLQVAPGRRNDDSADEELSMLLDMLNADFASGITYGMYSVINSENVTQASPFVWFYRTNVVVPVADASLTTSATFSRTPELVSFEFVGTSFRLAALGAWVDPGNEIAQMNALNSAIRNSVVGKAQGGRLNNATLVMGNL